MTALAAGIRVVLVDDHEALRVGVATILGFETDITVAAQAATAHEAIAAVELVHPDLVLMDTRLPDRSGIEATREIRAAHPEIRVLMFTAFADGDAVVAAIVAGAAGYLLKDARSDAIIRAIRRVHAGDCLLDPGVTETVLDNVRSSPWARDGRLARLTTQEHRVLELMSQSRTNREISQEMVLSEHTVKNYVASILEKLEVGRRAGAAAYLTARHPERTNT